MSTLQEIATKFRSNRAAAKQPNTWRGKKERMETSAADCAKKNIFNPDKYRDGWYFPGFKNNEQ